MNLKLPIHSQTLILYRKVLLFFWKAPYLEWYPTLKVKCKIVQSTGMFQNQTSWCPILDLRTSFDSQVSVYYRDVRSRSEISAKKGPRSGGQKNGHFSKRSYLPWYTRRALPGDRCKWAECRWRFRSWSKKWAMGWKILKTLWLPLRPSWVTSS
jgi:hypothetical protein